MRNKIEKPKVIQDPKDPVAPALLATSIRSLGAAMRAFDNAGITRRAVVVLIKDVTGLTKGEIDSVLSAMANLERTYLK